MPAVLLPRRRRLRRRRRLQVHPLPPPLRQEPPRLYRQEYQRRSQPRPSSQSLQTCTKARRTEQDKLRIMSERLPRLRLRLLSRTRPPAPRTTPPFNPTPSCPLRTRYLRPVLRKPALQTAPHPTATQHRVPVRDWAPLSQHLRHRDTMPASEASPCLHLRRAALPHSG